VAAREPFTYISTFVTPTLSLACAVIVTTPETEAFTAGAVIAT